MSDAQAEGRAHELLKRSCESWRRSLLLNGPTDHLHSYECGAVAVALLADARERERWQEAHGLAAKQRDAALVEVERLTRERDEATAFAKTIQSRSSSEVTMVQMAGSWAAQCDALRAELAEARAYEAKFIERNQKAAVEYDERADALRAEFARQAERLGEAHDLLHDAEAEELREWLERFAGTDESGEVNWARHILDEVDARDSAAFVETRRRQSKGRGEGRR